MRGCKTRCGADDGSKRETASQPLRSGSRRKGGPPTPEELAEIEALLVPPQLELMGLRFPDRDSKTDADYIRLSF